MTNDDVNIETALSSMVDIGEALLLEDADVWFERIGARYPQSHNRLDWSKVREHESVLVMAEPGEITSDVLRGLLEKTRATVTTWLEEELKKQDEVVIWVGDNTSKAVVMKLVRAVELYPALMSFPQHSYVVPTSLRWCLAYEMEGEMHFGRACDSDVPSC